MASAPCRHLVSGSSPLKYAGWSPAIPRKTAWRCSTRCRPGCPARTPCASSPGTIPGARSLPACLNQGKFRALALALNPMTRRRSRPRRFPGCCALAVLARSCAPRRPGSAAHFGRGGRRGGAPRGAPPGKSCRNTGRRTPSRAGRRGGGPWRRRRWNIPREIIQYKFSGPRLARDPSLAEPNR